MMSNQLMQFFTWEDVPANAQATAKAIALIAQELDRDMPECAEKTAGLRKLLECRDCFVRAFAAERVR